MKSARAAKLIIIAAWLSIAAGVAAVIYHDAKLIAERERVCVDSN